MNKIIAKAILVLLLLVVFLMPQFIDTKAAKADREVTAIFRYTGGLWWFEQSG